DARSSGRSLGMAATLARQGFFRRERSVRTLRPTPEEPRTPNDLPLFGRRMSMASRADHPDLRPGGHIASRMGISAIRRVFARSGPCRGGGCDESADLPATRGYTS